MNALQAPELNDMLPLIPTIDEKTADDMADSLPITSTLSLAADAIESAPTESPLDSMDISMHRAALVELLGLPSTASNTHVSEALARWRTECGESLPLLQRHALQLQEECDRLLTEQVDADLARHAAHLDEASQALWRTELLHDRSRALALLQAATSTRAATSSPTLPLEKAPRHSAPALHTRRGMTIPQSARLSNDRAVLQRQAVAAHQRAHHCGFREAWDAVQVQRPELFEPTTF